VLTKEDYEKIKNTILEKFPVIRYVGVLNRRRKPIVGDYRENVKIILNPQEIRLSFFYSGQNWENRKQLDTKIGTMEFSVVRYKKVVMISIPVEPYDLLVMSAGAMATHSDIIKIIEFATKIIAEIERTH